MALNGDTELYLWTAGLIAVILGIAFPLTIYEQKIVKLRWKRVTDFVEQHQSHIQIRPFHLKQKNDIIVPVFSGFLIHGHFTYICLDPSEDKQKALAFVRALKNICAANNSWHFDYFSSWFYGWIYYRKAIRVFGGA